VHTAAVEADQLGFPRGAILVSRVGGGKVHAARRRAVGVTLSGAGFGYSVSVSTPAVGSMVATVAKVRTPRSRPAVIDGAHGCGCA